MGDELDQQVEVVARLAPGAYDRGEILLAGDRPERENGKEIRAFPVTQA